MGLLPEMSTIVETRLRLALWRPAPLLIEEGYAEETAHRDYIRFNGSS